jgi:hypothetical protein
MASNFRPTRSDAAPRPRRAALVLLAGVLLVGSVSAAAIGIVPVAVVLFVLAGAALSPLALPTL